METLKYKQHRKLGVCTCAQCGASHTKPLSEITRNLKLGRLSFCSRECSLLYAQAHQKAPTEKQLEARRLIIKYSGNNRDVYSPFRETLRRCKRRFKECTISLEYLKLVWEDLKGICPYTKLKLVLPSQDNKDIPFGHLASLDRIDSSKGYIEGNVQFVSAPINYMKNTMSDDETKLYLREIFATAFTIDLTISSSSNIEELDAQAGN